jgi:hypothetical protein
MRSLLPLFFLLARPALADVMPGELLIKLAIPAKTDDDARGALRDIGARQGLEIDLVKRSLLGWVLARTDTEEPTRLLADKGVLAAQRHATWAALRSANDEYRDVLWGFDAIEADAAWNVTVGEATQRIGVVDTGTRRDHVDLEAKDVAGYDFVSSPWDSGDGDGREGDYSDEGGQGEFHGTHVAGTILARANDGAGVPGLNWRARLVTVRALGTSGSGTLLDIVEGSAWLAGIDIEGVPPVGPDRVGVINLSLGADRTCGEFEREVYGEIIDAGVVVVAAAGNDGNDIGTGAPANCPGVIAVGAVDASLELAPYSSFDERIDVLAPGGDDDDGILSCDGADPHGYQVLSGTSMAAPHVTGVVSLVQAVNPDLAPADVRSILRASEYTCGGCDDHAFLQADGALELARERSAAVIEPTDVSAAVCNDSRGNWDCPPHTGCVGGMCQEGAQGRGELGAACLSDGDCDSGLCDRARCTRPCDEGCDTGHRCVEGVVPGGLCRRLEAPDGCATTSSGSALALLPLACVMRRRLLRATDAARRSSRPRDRFASPGSARGGGSPSRGGRAARRLSASRGSPSR